MLVLHHPLPGEQCFARRVAASLFFAAVLLCLLTAPAAAQFRSLANPSFESNDPQGPGAANFQIFPNGVVPGWDSTSGDIELWDTNFNGVLSFAGNVHAEMNASTNSTLFQNICLINGEPIGWTFAHRARTGGAVTQTARFQVANSTGTVIQTLATQASTTSNLVWNVNTGNATYTGASGLQRVQFNTPDTGSFGNFLDGIQLTLRPFVQLSAATGAAVESTASANVPTLRITGSFATAITVNVIVTGGTASLGTDFTTPGGGASFAVTIPAGAYNDSGIPLGISIINDTVVEGSETIALSLNTGTGYTVAHTSACGATAQTGSTYTITDDDARVTLRKQWASAVVDDDAILTVTRGATVIDTHASNADSAGELDIDATQTSVVIGETVTLAETLPAGNIGAYTNAVACTGAADTNLSNGLTIGAGETSIICTYTNTRIPPVEVTKMSSVVSDEISASNPKSIPGATMRYCILITNPGSVAATAISATDNLPANITMTTASMRTGTTCATATQIEDQDDIGTDENDPYGMAFAAGGINGTGIVTGTAVTIAAGGTMALVFNVIIN